MMRGVVVFVVALSVIAGYLPAHAGDKGAKGASSKAYEHASENSVFNRVGDWFATIGKSDEEKDKIMAERKAKRAAKKLEKEVKEKKAKAEKKAKKAKKKAKDAGLPGLP